MRTAPHAHAEIRARQSWWRRRGQPARFNRRGWQQVRMLRAAVHCPFDFTRRAISSAATMRLRSRPPYWHETSWRSSRLPSGARPAVEDMLASGQSAHCCRRAHCRPPVDPARAHGTIRSGKRCCGPRIHSAPCHNVSDLVMQPRRDRAPLGAQVGQAAQEADHLLRGTSVGGAPEVGGPRGSEPLPRFDQEVDIICARLLPRSRVP